MARPVQAPVPHQHGDSTEPEGVEAPLSTGQVRYQYGKSSAEVGGRRKDVDAGLRRARESGATPEAKPKTKLIGDETYELSPKSCG
jgi:hypothetical protein